MGRGSRTPWGRDSRPIATRFRRQVGAELALEGQAEPGSRYYLPPFPNRYTPSSRFCRKAPTPLEPQDFLAGGGDMGSRMRAYPWDTSPLGPPQQWPQSLKTCVRILLTSRQPMFVWWGEHLINLYNDAYKQIVGGKHPEALGQPASVVWREIWAEVGPRAETAMQRNEGTYDEALQLIMERHGYREETYYTFSYSPVPDDDGTPGGILCANTDDTERITGQRQLALLSELGAATAESRSASGACTSAVRAFATNPFDLPFTLLFLEDELVACSGIRPDHPAGRAECWFRPGGSGLTVVRDLPPDLPTGAWPEPPHHAVLLPIQASGITGRLCVGLNPYRLLDDSYRDFLTLVANQLSAAVASAQAFEEEKKRSEALAELDRAKTAFFSNVSHEFRTPLTLILGPLEELLASSLPESVESELQVVHRNSLRLLKLVNSLLDFSRIEAGRVQAIYEPMDLAAITVDLASVFRSACERAGLELVLDCPPLPQPVFVDRDMWEKIVLNLLSNAFKHTFTGGITVSLEPVNDRARLSVADTGIGIPASAQDRLFERFYRVEGARGRSQEGSGIGLALVAELARLHGGQVEVSSVEGEGSTFSVLLPFGSAHLPAERIGAALELSSTATRAEAFVEEALRWLPEPATPTDLSEKRVSSPQGRVVIADDNADMREYLTRLLEDSWTVEAVSDGQAALEAVRRELPDVLLTDVMMPGLDGFSLVQHLRGEPGLSSVPIIMLSARAGEEARVEGLQSGADDYLIKPFSARELQARVSSVVSLSRVRRLAREREAELRAEWAQVLESISQAFMATDGDYRVLYVNREAQRTCNFSKQEMVGRTLWQLFPHVVGTDLETRYRDCRLQRQPQHLQYYSPRLERWFEIDIYPAREEGLAIYFRDISVQKRDQSVLNAQRHALEQALGGAPLPVVLSSLTTAVREQYPEQAVASVLLLDAETQKLRVAAAPDLPDEYNALVDGLPVGEHIGSCGSAAFLKRLVIAEDIATDSNWREYRQLAEKFALRACWATPIFSAQGHVLGTFAVYRTKVGAPQADDIRSVELLSRTAALILERGQAEASAQENRERLVASLQASGTGTYRWDMQADVLIWDEPLKRLFGLEAEAGVSDLEQFLERIHPEDRARVESEYERCHAQGGSVDLEFRIKHPSGHILWLYDRGQTMDGWMTGACVDVTARKQAEEEREVLLESERAARSEAERTSRLKDEFLATLSHELRTPLNAILGWSQMLRRQSSDPDMLEGLEVIERNSRVQTQLIEDLLDMSRIISGKMRLDVQPLDLQQVVRAAVLSVQPAAQAKDIRVQTLLDPNAGPVRGDPARLQQCLWNLVSNAVKFTPRGGKIQIALQCVNSHAEVRVSDTGIGIKPEFLPFIFDRFRQADASTTRSHGGLGLGLAIVRNLVELHGGRVRATSPGEGQGSTFVVELPLMVVHPLPEAGEVRHPRALPEPGPLVLPDLAAVVVLVVDDEADARDLIRRVLEECGAEVWMASSAREALEVLKRAPVGIILSDIGMPGEDGYEFIRQVRTLPYESGGSTPAAALTAFARPEDRTRALLAGYHAHLSKPVEPMELAALVARLAVRPVSPRAGDPE